MKGDPGGERIDAARRVITEADNRIFPDPERFGTLAGEEIVARDDCGARVSTFGDE